MSSFCPYCDYEAQGPRDEIAHMQAAHPDVIRERLAETGERETEFGPLQGDPVPMPETETEDYRIVVVPEALRPALEAWLTAKGLEMRRSPMGWLITPTDEAMARGDWTTLR